MEHAKKGPDVEMDEKAEQEFQARVKQVAERVSERILAMLLDEMKANWENGSWNDANVAGAWGFGALEGLMDALAMHMTVHICKLTNTLTPVDPGFRRMRDRIRTGLVDFFGTAMEIEGGAAGRALVACLRRADEPSGHA